MRKILCCVAVLLAGCATVYDQGAVPEAQARLKLAYDQCVSRARDFRSYSELTECYLAAERQSVVAIRLQKMDLFELYAQRARLLASEADAGKVAPEAFSARLDGLQRDFGSQVSLASSAEEARQQRVSAGLQAMGAGMQQAGATYQANQPKLPCTTHPLSPGGTVLTGSISNCP